MIVGYRVLYGPVTTGAREITTTSGRALTLTGLAPYTDYAFHVSAVNSNGAMGPFSSPLRVETEQSGTCQVDEFGKLWIIPSVPSHPAPGPVKELQYFNSTFTTITLSWQPPPAPNGVIILYQVIYSANGRVNTCNTTTPAVTIHGLVPKISYTFSVAGHTIAGPGTPQWLQTPPAAIRECTAMPA